MDNSKLQIIQTNLNRSREAQDLLLHHAEELGALICVVSEPARTPSSQQWFRSDNGLAALFINGRAALHPAVLIAKGHSIVVIRYGNIYIASCYVSPNVDYNGYAGFLDELTTLCSGILNKHLLICGDFNAHARLWGSRRRDFKGDLLADWWLRPTFAWQMLGIRLPSCPPRVALL
ncbi:uncharacterized protein [Temnothorax nylanderi]|uniref:uncharacterized protein n=1 Tax=Temnothorax nylanderi TaxID=102681 RepID=UPI003A839981